MEIDSQQIGPHHNVWVRSRSNAGGIIAGSSVPEANIHGVSRFKQDRIPATRSTPTQGL